jgi:hypothetical protein
MRKSRTLRELITAAYHAAGGTGDPPEEFRRQWANSHPNYCKRDGELWPPGTRFYSGSAVAGRPAGDDDGDWVW